MNTNLNTSSDTIA